MRDPRRERRLAERDERRALVHARERDRGRGAREQDEGRLLEEEVAHGRARESGATVEQAKRPDVQEQHQDGQRDEHRLREQGERRAGEDDEVARERRAPRVTHACVEREEPEEDRQHVLPLGDPRDGFDAQRVEGEERGDGDARHDAAGRADEQEEQQDRIRDVKHDVLEVRPTRGLRQDRHVDRSATRK